MERLGGCSRLTFVGRVLHALRELGEQVVDLEHAGAHRGSVCNYEERRERERERERDEEGRETT